MKKLLRSYMSFSRTERMGLIALCSLIIVLLAVRTTLHLWVHPPDHFENNKKLAAAWEVFKRSQPKAAVTDTGITQNDHQDAGDENEEPLANNIDINTADSATLVRLKGIGPVTAGKIIAYRNKKGAFTTIDQLLELGSFNSATTAILKKHMVVGKAN